MPACQRVGGGKGIRTPDLLNAIQTLFQLSYTPPRRSREYSKGVLRSPPRGLGVAHRRRGQGVTVIRMKNGTLYVSPAR